MCHYCLCLINKREGPTLNQFISFLQNRNENLESIYGDKCTIIKYDFKPSNNKSNNLHLCNQEEDLHYKETS